VARGGSLSSRDNSDSGDDTDDLIEDARNFVLIARRWETALLF
jgi:hypothetical protein